MKFTAIMSIGWWERAKHWKRIIDSMREAGAEEIIAWFNVTDRDWGEVQRLLGSPVTVFSGTRNTGMHGKYAACLLAKTELIYMQDDDIYLPPESIKTLTARAEASGYFCGPMGMNLCRNTDRHYSYGMAVTEGPCDVIVGRAWSFLKSALADGLPFMLANNIDLGSADDVLFSLACGAKVIPVLFTNLDEGGVGLSKQEGHLAERDAMAKRTLEWFK